MTSPPEHAKPSPFKKYLEVPESLKKFSKGSAKPSTSGIRLLTSEENIRFLEEKMQKKRSCKGKKEGRKGSKSSTEKIRGSAKEKKKTCLS